MGDEPFFEIFSVAVVGIAILVAFTESVWRARFKDSSENAKYRNNKKVAVTAKALTLEYYKYQIKNSVKATLFVALTAIASAIYMNDLTAFLVGLSYCAIIAAFIFLTSYRVKHGYFGTSAAEAAELIEFIARQTSEGNPPNSRKISIRLEREETRIREVEARAAPENT